MPKFSGYNPIVKKLRSDGGYRVEFDVSASDYDNIKDLPKLENVVLTIDVQENKENSV